MITTGKVIDKKLDINQTTVYSVELSIFRTPGVQATSKITSTVFEATACVSSGEYDPFNIGDLVYVGFVNNQIETPVIIGKIYKNNKITSSLGYYNINSLSVSDNTVLPENTTIGDITLKDIKDCITRSKLNEESGGDTSNLVTLDTAQTITGAKTFTGPVGNTQSTPGIYLGLDSNTTPGPNANLAIVSANNAAYIDLATPDVDYGFRIIKWNDQTLGTSAQFVYGSNEGTLTVPKETGTLATKEYVSGVLPTSINGMTGGTISSSVSINGGLTISSGTPLLLTGYGSGTYNKGAFVCNTTDKFGVECPRETDSSTANIVPFRIGARGGQLGNLEVGNISATSVAATSIKVNNVNVALTTDLATKQDTLVSGSNIKTLNGVPILGSGNLNISGTIAAPTLIGYTTSSSNKFLFTGIDLTSQKGVGLFTFGNCFTFINLYGLQSGVNYKFPGSFIYNSNGSVITTTVNVIWYSETNTLWISSGNGNYSMVNGYTGYLYLITLP